MLDLIQSISESEIEYIASLDYDRDVEKHREALKQVILVQEGLIFSDQYWFPYEVIELGSHRLDPEHEREFVICTLLVILNVANEIDTITDLDDKQRTRSAEYKRLSDTHRCAILAAYSATLTS